MPSAYFNAVRYAALGSDSVPRLLSAHLPATQIPATMPALITFRARSLISDAGRPTRFTCPSTTSLFIMVVGFRKMTFSASGVANSAGAARGSSGWTDSGLFAAPIALLPPPTNAKDLHSHALHHLHCLNTLASSHATTPMPPPPSTLHHTFHPTHPTPTTLYHTTPLCSCTQTGGPAHGFFGALRPLMRPHGRDSSVPQADRGRDRLYATRS